MWATEQSKNPLVQICLGDVKQKEDHDNVEMVVTHTHVFPSEKFSEVFSFLSEIFWCDEDIYDKFVKQVFHHANIFLKALMIFFLLSES